MTLPISKRLRTRPDWLSRALSRAGILSRKDAEAAIRSGRVTVNGRVQRLPLAPLKADDRVGLDGRRVELRSQVLAAAYHKEAGVVTARQPGGVFELFEARLPSELRPYNWHAIGRLDKNTTGLLLFTNDERLVAHVTSPATRLPKRYVATVGGRVDDLRLEPLRRGLVLDDGPTHPARARVRGPTTVEVTVTEGRYHQVKRMLGAVGLPVLTLHREAIGAVELGTLASGQLRVLSEEDIRRGLDAPALFLA